MAADDDVLQRERTQAIRKLAHFGSSLSKEDLPLAHFASSLSEEELTGAAQWAPRELSEAEAETLLQTLGYEASAPDVWGATPDCGGPELQLSLDQHFEDRHTWYLIKCTLVLGKRHSRAQLKWWAPRRLAHLRSCLYEPVKAHLGESYADRFNGVHFARHGGLAGTTERLHAWLATMCSLVNTGLLPPRMVAAVLEFLQAPDPEAPNPPGAPPSLESLRRQFGGAEGDAA